MAYLGEVSFLTPVILSMSGMYTATNDGTPLGIVSSVSILSTDYAYLAGMVGQSLVAATGGEPIEVTPTGPSGAFNANQIVSIIGQQIAAATSAAP